MKKFVNEIIIFLIKIIFIHSIIKIPFKKVYKDKNMTSENIMDILLYNDLQINLEIETPPQLYPVLIKLQESPTFILSNNSTKKIKKYNPQLSSTCINYNEKVNSYSQYHCYDSIYIQDTFYFDNKKIQIKDFYFILSNNAKFDSTLTSGELGLKFYSMSFNEKAHFLYQLKNKQLIEYPIFTLEYINKEEGNLIIGNYPHIFNNKIYKEEDYIFTNVGTFNSVTQWNIYFDKIIANNSTINSKITINLYYEFSFILGTERFKNTVYQNFFEKYFNNKSCSINRVSQISFYTYTECSKDINIKEFPDLIFINNNLKFNFTFTYEDLFMEYGDKYYFLIVFKTYKDEWSFGDIFFKKYQIVFDKDKKTFGLYKKKFNSSFNFSPWLYVILLLFFLIISIILIIYLIRLLMKKRKIRANELEDQFEYIPYN